MYHKNPFIYSFTLNNAVFQSCINSIYMIPASCHDIVFPLKNRKAYEHFYEIDVITSTFASSVTPFNADFTPNNNFYPQ